MSQSHQKFIIGYSAVTVIGAVALGFLCLSASSEHDEALQAYTAKKSNVEALEKAPLFPNDANVRKKKQQVTDYAIEVDKLHAALVEYQKPLDGEIAPDGVSTKLGKYKTQLEEVAKGRLTLPKDFDLGLRRYLAGVPRTGEPTQQVDYLVESVNHLTKAIINSGVSEIVSIQCPEMEYEKPDPADAPPIPQDAKGPKGGKKTTTNAKAKDPKAKDTKVDTKAKDSKTLTENQVFNRYKILLTLTGSEKSLQDFLNQIATAPAPGPFFVTNLIRVESGAKEGPKQGAIAPPEQGDNPEIVRDAVYILGNDKVTMRLDLDLLRFRSPESVSPDGAPATDPAPETPETK